jgi:hypothetical protein
MKKPSHTCFNVRDRGEGREPYWAIIGSAWTNKDGSLNVTLDSLPMDGKIVIRVRKDKDEAPAEAEA